MRIALLLPIVLILGCGQSQPPDGHPPNPIRASSLIDTYRSFPDQARRLYNGQIVTVRVSRGHYVVAGRELHWYATGDRQLPPAIVFRFHFDLGEIDSELLITGRCRGRDYDNVNRGDNVFFHIDFDNGCSLAEVHGLPGSGGP